MADHQLSFLIPEAAKSTHAELLAALGTEANAGQWMTFMQAVTRLLPDVLSVGRPTAEAIKRSAIGQLGFSSWAAMIEAPTDAGGLGWNVSAWRAWRRAWSVVQAYPWLRDQPMSSSEVNVLAAEVKRNGAPFPRSIQELEEYRAKTLAEAEQRRADSSQALHDRVTAAETAAADLRQQLTAANARAEILAANQAQVQTRADVLTGQVGQQLEQIEQLKRQLAAAQKPKPNPEPAPPLTRWQHLLAALTGRP